MNLESIKNLENTLFEKLHAETSVPHARFKSSFDHAVAKTANFNVLHAHYAADLIEEYVRIGLGPKWGGKIE